MLDASDVFGKSYITHDVDASHDPKCAALIDGDGLEAYARWWLLLETFGRSSCGFIDLTARGQKAMLKRELRFDTMEQLDRFLYALGEYELIDPGRLPDAAMSQSFIKRHSYFEQKAAAGRKSGDARRKKKVDD